MYDLTVALNFSGPLMLPLAYNHILQSAVYSLLPAEDNFAHRMHDTGFIHGLRSYKLFCFGGLSGRHTVVGHRITFYNEVQFKLRAVEYDFLEAAAHTLAKRGQMRLLNTTANVESITLVLSHIQSDTVHIRMISPVTVHRTDESRKTIYYAPFESEFAPLVDLNFRRKWEAWCGLAPKAGVALRPLAVTAHDKCVTTFKKIYITAYFGEYELHGEPDSLKFLYAAGLGDRNSQGFGMFEVLDV